MAYGGERRERKPFEPPPWEREAFERIARRPEELPPAEVLEPDPAAVAPASAEEPVAERTAGPTATPATEGAVEAETAVPDGFDAMLAHLRGEEKEQQGSADTAGAWVALAVTVFGVVMFVWGFVAMLRGGGKLTAIAMALALMGLGGLFAAAGGWSAAKNLKRQGVL